MLRKSLFFLVVFLTIIPMSLFAMGTYGESFYTTNRTLRTSKYLYYLSDQTGCRNIFRGIFSNNQISNIEQVTFIEGTLYNSDIDAFDVFEETGKIVYIKLSSSNEGDIYIMDEIWTQPYLLTTELSNFAVGQVKWSFDGCQIIYSQSNVTYNHNLEIFKIDSNGDNNNLFISTNQPLGRACHKNDIEVTENGYYLAVTPQWSAHNTNHNIWFLSNSGQFSQITSTTSVGESSVMLSPDGNKLLCRIYDNSQNYGINYMVPDGSSPIAITPYHNIERFNPYAWINNTEFIYGYLDVNSQDHYSVCSSNLDYSQQTYLLGPDSNNYSQALLVDALSLFADFSADNTSVFPDEEIQFNDLSLNNPTYWEWDFDNDAIIDSYEQNPSWSYSTPGIYSVNLTIGNNDESISCLKEDYISVNLFVSPTINLTSEYIDFGEIEVNNSESQQLTITNFGEQNLTISNIISSTNRFAIEFSERDITFTLDSMESRTLDITFTPNQVGIVSGSILFFTNDPNNMMKVFPVSGIGRVLSAEEILSDAGFILKVSSQANFDFPSILSNSSNNYQSQGNKLVATVQFDDYISHQSTYSGVAGENSDLFLKVVLEENGDIYLGSYSTEIENHLRLFTFNASNNYVDFDNNVLSQEDFQIPRNMYTSSNLKQTMLNCILRDLYQELWTSTNIMNGPNNNFELYNCEYEIKNNFTEQAIILRSFIYNHQMDYGHYNEQWRTIHSSMNHSWSPVGFNPTTNTNLFRSFDIEYSNCSNSMVYIYTYTDNGMNSNINISGISGTENTDSSNNDWRNWSRSFNAGTGEYSISNTNCASSAVYLNNQYPTSVQMSGYTSWSVYSQCFMTAAFGDDIIVNNNQEAPSPGDDNNPMPNRMYIPVGWTDIDNDETPILPPVNVVASENGTTVEITWELLGARVLASFNVYRFLIEDELNHENWTLINEDEVLNQFYIDQNWSELSEGSYKYAVIAIYTNGPSPAPAISNELTKQSLISTSFEGDFELNKCVFRQPEVYSTLYIINNGNLPLDLYSVNISNDYFSLNSEIPSEISPKDSIGIILSVPTTSVGIFDSDLVINNNSSNMDVLTINLVAECVCYPASEPTGVIVSMSGNNAQISWDSVTTDVMGNIIIPDTYVVYYCGIPDANEDNFYFLTNTSDLTAFHNNVGLFDDQMFYLIKAYIDVNDDLLSSINNNSASIENYRLKDIEKLIEKHYK